MNERRGARVFFDTNVLVYAFDVNEPEKQQRAKALYRHHGASDSLLISTQVLQEFYVTVTRKFPKKLSEAGAYQVVEEFLSFPLVQVDAGIVLAAIRRSQRDKLSFWDGLIVEAALSGGAKTLLTEDLQDGRSFDGLRVENPFQDLA